MRNAVVLSLGIILLLGIVTAVSLGAEGSDGDDAADLTAAINNAVSGDTIEMTEDATLTGNTVIGPGVTLKDVGNRLIILPGQILSVEGSFVSTGALTVRGSLAVTDGGILSVENNGIANVVDPINISGNVAAITGSLNIYDGGSLKMGLNSDSGLLCGNNGKMVIEGDLVLGNAGKRMYSLIEAKNSVVTGSLTISDGSAFRVTDILTVGSPSTTTADLSSDAAVSGKVSLGDSAFVMVYGDAGFGHSNIAYQSVSTVFTILDKAYATEYKYRTPSNSRTIMFPATSNLVDFHVINWRDGSGNILNPDSNIQIGSLGYEVINGDLSPRMYTITLVEDKSIRWMVNGLPKSSSGVVTAQYDSSCTIGIATTGDSALPSIYMNGKLVNGTSVSVKVTGDMTFMTSNSFNAEDDRGGSSSLHLVLTAIIVILVAALTVLILEYRKKMNV